MAPPTRTPRTSRPKQTLAIDLECMWKKAYLACGVSTNVEAAGPTTDDVRTERDHSTSGADDTPSRQAGLGRWSAATDHGETP